MENIIELIYVTHIQPIKDKFMELHRLNWLSTKHQIKKLGLHRDVQHQAKQI